MSVSSIPQTCVDLLVTSSGAAYHCSELMVCKSHPHVIHITLVLEVEVYLTASVAHLSSPTLQEVDWEVEMAVVIGKRGKHIKVRWKGGSQPREEQQSQIPPLLVLTTPTHWCSCTGTQWAYTPPLASPGANV